MLPKAPVPAAAPLAGLHAIRMLSDMMAKLQQKRHRILGNCIRSVGRYIGNHYVCRTGRLNINHIITGCQHADKLHVGAFLNGFTGDGRLIGIHGLCICDPLYHLVAGSPVIHSQCSQRLKALPA